jgi:hypothetical protein
MQASLFQLIRAYFLILLFGFYWLATGLFYHTHTDENNRIVTHSHPFGSENHQHSNNSFVVIDRISCFESTQTISFDVLSAWCFHNAAYFIAETTDKSLLSFNNYRFSRPPPAI